MTAKKVYAVYFSPTKGSETYVKEIAKHLSADYEEINLTVPANRAKEYRFNSEELVILGAPVYAGRLPQIAGGIFDCLKGSQTPAVFTVSYGNREFDDALLEEMEICEANGFKGIAAGAWIAPHTFSDKIAANRPAQRDLKKAEEFAAAIKRILENDTWKDAKLTVPGNHPYKEAKVIPFYPAGNENCGGCKKCVDVCPTGAICAENIKETDTTKCIACLACVKNCPSNGRAVAAPAFAASVAGLEERLISPEKEAAVFLITD
ncbi:MAG: 4Fe-4S binding protein [Lachnospiraceae bacterium]|nr:4Fe-4S binding protein [Lachnospiraceae bacterium]